MDAHTKKQLVAAGAFSVTAAAIEYYILPDNGNGLHLLPQLGLEPIGYNLYPYHVYIALPIGAITALAISWNKNPVRTVMNFLQTFPSLAILEDESFFIMRGLDPNNPKYGKFFPVLGEWTTDVGGAVPVGEYGIPIWWIMGAAIAGGSWIIDNLVFKTKP